MHVEDEKFILGLETFFENSSNLHLPESLHKKMMEILKNGTVL